MTWANNIPKKGILCKPKGAVSIVKIIGYDLDIKRVFDDDANLYKADDLEPLTPQEWWQFAPWNYDMDIAPQGLLFLKYDNGHIDRGCARTNIGRPIAWLPLPEKSE
ncbi:MAG: hypothetical protein ACXV8O_01560 [Methylobacter sp.]